MVAGKALIDEISCDGCSLCFRVCPAQAIAMIPADKSRMYSGQFRHGSMVYGRLAPGEENSGKMVNELRRISKEIATRKCCSINILDGPPGIGCPVLSTITGVDKVVVVTEPTLSGFSDLKRTIEMVRYCLLPVYVIINKCTLNEEVTLEIENWCSKEGISIIALLPFDRDIVEALVARQTIVEYRPDSEITMLLKEAFQKITEKEISPKDFI